MKFLSIIGMALLYSLEAMAQDNFIKISDTINQHVPYEGYRGAPAKADPKGACYIRHTLTGRSVKKLPGFPQEFKVSGRAIIKVTVDPRGKIISAALLSADPGCNKLAMGILKYLQFSELEEEGGKPDGVLTLIFKKGTEFKD